MKRILVTVLAFVLFFQSILTVKAEGPEIEAPAAILMEASTGTVLYEKAADEKRSPASVTKIMTVLLIFEEMEKGRLKLSDEVTTSAHAKSMGGSQVYLEEGERQTVETMLKCILIASGNDASVAMAEHISGSEQEFVRKMNERARQLGMENTNFVDCCGLTEDQNHYTSARDIAIMSRELVTRFPQVYDYTTIWMENITHVTRQGSSEFGLTNTNKLLRSYDGCKGLKTGSTSTAKFCLSATAVRNDIELISVILTAPDSKVRFKNAADLLNYGFGKCNLYADENNDKLAPAVIKGGVADEVTCYYENEFRYLDTAGADLSGIRKEIRMNEEVQAPVEKGGQLGEAVYYLNDQKIGSVKILSAEDIEKAGFFDYLGKIVEVFLK